MARFERGRAGASAWLLLTASVLVGCKPLDDTLASVPIFAFMRVAPALGPYEAPRPAPPGSVPFAAPGGVPRAPISATGQMVTEQERIAFGETHPNPYPPTEENVEAGRALFNRYCAVCHGAGGAGDGPLVGPGRFPQLATMDLTAPATAARTDGYIYTVIWLGRGLMPRYGDRVTDAERWLIVNYIRHLQQQAGTAAAPASMPAPEPIEPPAGDAGGV